MKLKNLILLCCSIGLASCVVDDADMAKGLEPVTFSVADDQGAFTRATSSITTFTQNEKVKVFVKPDGASSYTGYDYTVATTSSSPSLTDPSTPPYFPAGNSTTVQAYAYYPSTAGTTFSVSTDQTANGSSTGTTDATRGYKGSDLMYCANKTITKGNSSSATLTMSHKMAQLKIVVSVASGSGLTLKSVKVNAKYQVSFTASTGNTSVTGSATDITGWTGSATSNTCYILIPPQAINGITVKIATGNSTAGEIATYSFTNTESLLAGMSYTMNLTVGKQDVGVTTSISTWDPSGTLTMNPIQSVLDLSTLTADKTIEDNMILTGTTSYNLTIDVGCMVVLSDATINTRIQCLGDATIILNRTNKVPKGITPGPDSSILTIAGDGSLTIDNCDEGNAGIGAEKEKPCGFIDIYSGDITSTGGEGGAGIGGGENTNYLSYSCSGVVIRGGNIIAQGGKWAAGIGSGEYGRCNGISIEGGQITAVGGHEGAGIGGGSDCSYGDIDIYGGIITATGGQYSTGIGHGYAGPAENGDISITMPVTKVIAVKGASSTFGHINPYFSNTNLYIDDTLYDSGEDGSSRIIGGTRPMTILDVTSAHVGWLITNDGYVYQKVSKIPSNKTAVAMICYVYSGISPYNVKPTDTSGNYRGLAIALKDASENVWCGQSSVTCLGTQRLYLGDAKSDLNGMKYTMALLNHDGTGSHTSSAALDAASYYITPPIGTSGWFLPSIGQWNLMLMGLLGGSGLNSTEQDIYYADKINAKLTQAGLDGSRTAPSGGNALQSDGYWSSTEYNASDSWDVFLDVGGIYNDSKSCMLYVRPVRAF